MSITTIRSPEPPLRTRFRPTTALVFAESPGSLTFEVQDIPAIAAAAHARGITVVLDNTWATPLGFRAFEHGVDVSVHAVTKYIGGHSDVLLGAIVANAATFPALHRLWTDMGVTPSADDCFLGLRGLRTLGVRLRRHEASALEIATWLAQRPEVREVLYPALPGDRGHALWKRDFRCASGLFGVVLQPVDAAQVAKMLDGMRLFGLGWSWGGFESLMIPTMARTRADGHLVESGRSDVAAADRARGSAGPDRRPRRRLRAAAQLEGRVYTLSTV